MSLVGGEITTEGGNLWITETNGIGSFSPSRPNNVQVYSQGLPTSPPPGLEGITTGPDNNIWFTESNAHAIGMLNTSNLAQPIQNFDSAQGLPSNARPFGITVGPDAHGNSVIWFTDVSNNAIGMIDPTSHAITEFPVPASLAGFNGLNSEITTSGGKLYFTEVKYNSGVFNSAAIGIYTPATNTFNEVSMNGPSGEEPFGIAVGSDGNIWFTEAVPDSSHPGSFLSSAVGVVNPTSLTVSEFPLSKPSGGVTPFPSRITVGPDGNIWFTDSANGAIGSLNPTSHAIGPLNPIPTTVVPNPNPVGITAGPDGNLWFADTSGAVGQVTLDTKLAITTEPPATVTPGSSFGLTAQVEYSDTNVVDTAYTGNVTIALTSPGSNVLGGTTTMPVTAGVASFTTLTLANPGTNFTLTATAGSLTSAPSAGITVTAITVPAPTPTPTSTKTVVIGEQPIFQRKLNKKGKPIGKAVLSGFALDFSVPLNAASASNTANYQVDTVTTMRVKRKIETILHPIKNFTVSYVAASDAIQIKLGATETFPTGGQITVLGGLTTASGSTLSGPAVFTVSKGGKSIGPS